MSLNGIDISSYQEGIDLYAVPADFVIVKATQGCGYVNPDFERQAQSALAAGKLLGIYHYAATNYGGGDPEAEAEFFLSKFSKYHGYAVPVLDWESIQNDKVGEMFSWCEPWCKKVEGATGVKPLIYIQQSYMQYFEGCGYGLWVAQYATNDDVWGYQDHPWNEGAYDCLVRQYTSCGRLEGWDGRLDLNKFYGDRQDWVAMCGGSADDVSDGTAEPATDDVLVLAAQAAAGMYGNGENRKSALGDLYEAVQSEVNVLVGASDDELADLVIAGKYGTGEYRKTVLGQRYAAVQAKVNEKLGAGASPTIPGGAYACRVARLNVRTSPSTASRSVAQYSLGQSVVLDEWASENEGYVWGRYTGYSGEKRYVAVRETGGEEYLSKI